jgi:hypothetical protein
MKFQYKSPWAHLLKIAYLALQISNANAYYYKALVRIPTTKIIYHNINKKSTIFYKKTI